MKLQIPKTITSVESGWCPGCGHGIVARILTEVAEEMGVSDKVIMVRDVACGAMISNVVTFDNVGGAHGRPIITACGVKRVRKDALLLRIPAMVRRIPSVWKAPSMQRCEMKTFWHWL